VAAHPSPIVGTTAAATLTVMCLLVVVWHLDPETPLVIGANRDERLDRPARSMTVLRTSGPRMLGGIDEEAGGTWLAVNEHGVVAGLTNRPSPEGRDLSKRSRGELPIALAEHRDAASAVQDFAGRFRPRDYNPAWLLVGDRVSLYALDMTGEDLPQVEELGPGIHILENNPLHAPSPKVDHVRGLLGDLGALDDTAIAERVRSVLADHSIPAVPAPAPALPPSDAGVGVGVGVSRVSGDGESRARPVESLAACVHTDTYGTRSSTLVSVPAAPDRPPRVLVADGHPCTAPWTNVTALFEP
jgi:uncharacterized protein with NRDE domain